MTVRSTPTAADAMLERKKILDGNAILVQERDTLKRDLSNAQTDLNQTRSERKAEESIRDDLRRSNEVELREFESVHRGRSETVFALEVKETAISGRITLKESREAALDTAIQAKTDHHATLSEETTKYQSLTNTAKEAHTETMEMMQKQLLDATSKLIETEKSIEDTKIEEEGLLINRRAEDKRIARARGDLSIWEARIKKAAEAVGMDPAKVIV